MGLKHESVDNERNDLGSKLDSGAKKERLEHEARITSHVQRTADEVEDKASEYLNSLKVPQPTKQMEEALKRLGSEKLYSPLDEAQKKYPTATEVCMM